LGSRKYWMHHGVHSRPTLHDKLRSSERHGWATVGQIPLLRMTLDQWCWLDQTDTTVARRFLTSTREFGGRRPGRLSVDALDGRRRAETGGLNVALTFSPSPTRATQACTQAPSLRPICPPCPCRPTLAWRLASGCELHACGMPVVVVSAQIASSGEKYH
jgi:hypothetical protein